MLGTSRPDPSKHGEDLRYLGRSALFLLLLCGLGFFSREHLISGFSSNVLLNGTILGILAFGILYTVVALAGVLRVSRAASNAATLVQEVQAGNKPLSHANEILLGPSQAGVGDFLRTVHRILSRGDASATLPYILDSVAARAEDRRAFVRYLTSALVLLGLIGTFYGLLVTIGGVRDVLGGLTGNDSGDTVAMLLGLKERLATPLDGMGIAFSSSLFGLLASLVLAFLELQLFHAQNTLHARLETLVVSDLLPLWQRAPENPAGATEAATPAYTNALLNVTGERLEALVALLEKQQREERGTARLNEQLASLGERIESLRETIHDLERDRTGALSNELRVIARTLSDVA